MPKKAPVKATKAPAKKEDKGKNPLFEKRPRNFGIGQAIQPKRDLWRYVRWPHYIQLQRKRKVLISRLKIPPTINQFSRTLDKATATQLFKLLNKYRPDTKLQQKQQLLKAAEAKSKGETVAPSKPKSQTHTVHYGVNEVTRLVEKKKAKFVAIAHDVDPIELVVWLPTLCRKMGVPYCIVKGKARLGAAVHQSTATCLAITSVDKEDVKDLNNLADTFNQSFNSNVDLRRAWGGGRLGNKALAAQRKREKAVAKENAAKMNV